MKLPLIYSEEVHAALDTGRPVVALESTIITHGMPYPENLKTAKNVEDVVRKNGAVPATIAIINQAVHIGLSAEQLEWLAKANNVLKLSRADLAFAVAQGRTGATTVAATMICAALAGISVFATGGIGGVHKGAEDTFDVSADLLELAQTPVTVVCAGAKAILDLNKTMEVLETHGVPVIGYRTDLLPAFWSRMSDIPIPMRCDTPAQISNAHKIRSALGLKGGQLVANPIPAEAELSREYMEPIIAQAVAEAEAQGVAAKALTPFLLGKILELTKGKSLIANIALVRSNAELASKIAIALG
ncbi:MAG TPA: pseudouridine-5-phosphate glycosidase [Rhodobacteraceae bacterium]|nr:pseudouridine-5-phosphate glycosidase [Paracoccaceae bacterium]